MIEATGKYGRLSILADAPPVKLKNNKNRRMVYCACDCGNFGVFNLAKVRFGHTASCGCLARDARTKHGLSLKASRGTMERKTYAAWQDMKNRCRNPNLRNFYLYGGRGISVHQEWFDSYEAFLRDVGLCPSKELSLGRIENSGNYEPRNVRWEDISQQANNTRANRILDFQGRKQNLSQWAKELGYKPILITTRLRAGWSVEKALTTPISPRRKKIPV